MTNYKTDPQIHRLVMQAVSQALHENKREGYALKDVLKKHFRHPDKVMTALRVISGFLPKQLDVKTKSETTIRFGLSIDPKVFENFDRFRQGSLNSIPMQDRPLLSPVVCVEESGHGEPVAVGTDEGSAGKSEQPSRPVGEGTLQIDDHNIRQDDTGHPSESRRE